MAFFKDLTKKISEGVQDATEKASELVEVQKLNSAITKEKNAIDEVKQQIGDKIFSLYQSGEQMPELLTADLQAIGVHLQTIAGLEVKIREVKGEAQPASPAPPQAPPAAAPVTGDQPAAAPKFCPECGARLAEGTAFCGECGAKVQ